MTFASRELDRIKRLLRGHGVGVHGFVSDADPERVKRLRRQYRHRQQQVDDIDAERLRAKTVREVVDG